jgi:hypothetical protein
MSPRSRPLSPPARRSIERLPAPRREAKGWGSHILPSEQEQEDAGFGLTVNYYIGLADKLLNNKASNKAKA